MSSKGGLKKKKTFVDSEEEAEEEEEEVSAVPRSSLSAFPRTADRAGMGASCLQRLGPRLFVAFFDEDAEEDADEQGVVPEELSVFKHVVCVRCLSAPKKRRGRPADAPVETSSTSLSLSSPSTDGAFSSARRLRLTLPLSSSSSSSPTSSSSSDVHLSAEQMRAAVEFVRATPAGEEVLVTAPGLRPGDAAVLVALCVAAERREQDGAAWSVREMLREVDEEEGVVGFWKGVVQEEETFVAESVLNEMR